MSLNDILSTAVSGLAASQGVMRTVANNIANANTAGYARERVALSTTTAGGRITGVLAGEPSRVADRFLESTVYSRTASASWSDSAASYLNQMESLLGGVGVGSNLTSRLDSIADAATKMSSLQGSPQSIAQFTGNVSQMLDGLKEIQGDAKQLQSNAESEIIQTVDRINTLLKQVDTLNDGIAQKRGLGQSTSGSENQRAAALEELTGLMQVKVREQPDGRVTIEADSGQVLLDKRLRQLSYVKGVGASQPVYGAIDIRFADDDGTLGASTGDKINSPAIGGKLGSLINVRDNLLPDFQDDVGTMVSGLSEALNSASNAGSTVPPPASMTGRDTGLTGADRLGFTGKAVFAVTDSTGKLVASTTVDFDALGAGATVDDAVAAINAGLAGSGTASFANGRLTISAAATGNGVVVAQDPTTGTNRAGLGFSHYFGLNDIVTTDAGAVPSGLIGSDAAGFAAGQTAEIVLRDASGRPLATHSFTATGTETLDDIVTQLNGGSLGAYGRFAIDSRGRLAFTADTAYAGASMRIPTDTTSRYGTGLSLSALAGQTDPSAASVRADMLADPTKLPLAKLQLGAGVGQQALGAGDFSGSLNFIDSLNSTIDLARNGPSSIAKFAATLMATTASNAAQANTELDASKARLSDATQRRDNFAGVNVDEELAQLVVFQNSYSAAARVMTTANQMYDSLLAMVR
ncbi:MAG TPA: flagellar hook-associated protein FlgK [Sphingobium sp.]|uniref:flagellar hook-associated protein FlgK n=1 Tax=Sphingobium sp. TaxID=1912891 RepID=UPI002ED072CC